MLHTVIVSVPIADIRCLGRPVVHTEDFVVRASLDSSCSTHLGSLGGVLGAHLSTKRVNGYLHVVWYLVLSIDPSHHKCLWFCPWSLFRSENISHVPTQGGIYLEYINMQILSPCSVVFGSLLDPTYLDCFWLLVGFALSQSSE